MSKATYITKFRMSNGDTVDASAEWESLDLLHATLAEDLKNPFVTITGDDGGKTLLATNRIVMITIKKVG